MLGVGSELLAFQLSLRHLFVSPLTQARARLLAGLVNVTQTAYLV